MRTLSSIAIWFLTAALLGATTWLAWDAPMLVAVMLWLSWVAALGLTPALARWLGPTQGALFVILVLMNGWLLTLLFPGELVAGTLANAFFIGAAAGLGVHARVRFTAVPAVAVAGIWFAAQALLVGASALPPLWIAYSLAVLVVGGIVGLLFRALDPGLDAAASSDDPDELLRMAREALDRFDLARARRLLDRAAELAPEHLELRRVQYAAWKFDPKSDQFHDVAAALMQQADDVLMSRYYQDYLAVTQVRPQLPVKVHLQIARRLARNGDADEAARISNLHLQRDPQTPGLPGAMIATAEAYLEQAKPSKAARYSDTIMSMFPDTEQARRAEAMLAEIGNARRHDESTDG